MSDERFDVTFSGQISDGAEPQQVKARIGALFKTDGAQLEQLFSGRRVVVKRNVDAPTAAKFVAAFRSAGAEAHSEPVSSSAPAADAAPGAPARSATPPAAGAPPSTAPLGVTADQIGELDATLAPPGEDLRDASQPVPEPQYDLSDLELAPVGSDLGEHDKEPPPPPPDTSKLSLAD